MMNHLLICNHKSKKRNCCIKAKSCFLYFFCQKSASSLKKKKALPYILKNLCNNQYVHFWALLYTFQMYACSVYV